MTIRLCIDTNSLPVNDDIVAQDKCLKILRGLGCVLMPLIKLDRTIAHAWQFTSSTSLSVELRFLCFGFIAARCCEQLCGAFDRG